MDNEANPKMQRIVKKVSNPLEFGKVAVVYGGDSAERDVSLMSGDAVYKGLIEKNVDAHLVDFAQIKPHQLIEHDFDRVWIALHGRGGEDGSLQGALEQLNLPYTGSGVLGSALGMDKVRSKKLFEAAGLKTPKSIHIIKNQLRNDYANIVEELGLPIVVKPALEGSSIGMTIVQAIEELETAIAKALQSDDVVLLEQFISGKELTGAVLQDESLPLIYIQPSGFYDYDAKYFSDETQYHCPSGLDQDLENDLRNQCLQAFQAVGAFGWGRTDLILDADGSAWILEVNTVPGMTSHSLVPMAALESGYSFSELVWKVLETSFIDCVGVRA